MPNLNNIDYKKWIVNFTRSIAYSTKDVIAENMTNTSSILSEIGSAAENAKENATEAIDKVTDGLRPENIKNSKQYKDAMAVIKGAVRDIKTGDFNSKYNILISNPPYIKYDEPVDPATKFEPQNALFADHNGLEFYEVILKRSHEFMESTNIIAFEIGETQATEIETLAKKEYPNANVIVKKDLQERNRYLFIIND